jgi:putative DNA primase/helicase
MDASNIVNAPLIIPETLNECIKNATDCILFKYDQDNHPSYHELEKEILREESKLITFRNLQWQDKRLKIPDKLCASQIGDVLLKVNYIKRIRMVAVDDSSLLDRLAIYDDDKGIYVSDLVSFEYHIRALDYTITDKGIKEVMSYLYSNAPIVLRTMEPNLTAVNNGIFDTKRKILLPFSPDMYFLTKCATNYDPMAYNVVIHNYDDGTDWDVESWVASLSDDPEIVQLLWEIMSALVRPFVSWDKSAWFYSETGCNGKGTLCSLMRNLCGDGVCDSISIADFSDRFALGNLINKLCIINDENDVGTFVDKTGKLKALVTHDVVTIENKYQKSVNMQFFGLIIQCLNEYPRFKDKTESFYRRQLFIPFTKCFTGKERKYIKDDYLKRPEVLEYVLYKVLNMDFNKLSEPAACRNILDDYKEYNDTIRQFLNEMLDELVWDFVPFSFLYDLYKAWSAKNNPTGLVVSKITFVHDLMTKLDSYPCWYCDDSKKVYRPGHRMDKTEMLIAEYDLRDWQDPTYVGNDITKICSPKLKQHYAGIFRNVMGAGKNHLNEDC